LVVSSNPAIIKVFEIIGTDYSFILIFFLIPKASVVIENQTAAQHWYKPMLARFYKRTSNPNFDIKMFLVSFAKV
jgi:hypothetical protein